MGSSEVLLVGPRELILVLDSEDLLHGGDLALDVLEVLVIVDLLRGLLHRLDGGSEVVVRPDNLFCFRLV